MESRPGYGRSCPARKDRDLAPPRDGLSAARLSGHWLGEDNSQLAARFSLSPIRINPLRFSSLRNRNPIRLSGANP